MEHLFQYFHNEIRFQKGKTQYDEEHRDKIRFLYFFAILFIILLICSFFNII